MGGWGSWGGRGWETWGHISSSSQEHRKMRKGVEQGSRSAPSPERSRPPSLELTPATGTQHGAHGAHGREEPGRYQQGFLLIASSNSSLSEAITSPYE